MIQVIKVTFIWAGNFIISNFIAFEFSNFDGVSGLINLILFEDFCDFKLGYLEKFFS